MHSPVTKGGSQPRKTELIFPVSVKKKKKKPNVKYIVFAIEIFVP